MDEESKRWRFSVPMDEPEKQEVEDSKETSLFNSLTEVNEETEETQSVDVAEGLDAGAGDGLDAGSAADGFDCDCDSDCDSDCDGGCDGGM